MKNKNPNFLEEFQQAGSDAELGGGNEQMGFVNGRVGVSGRLLFPYLMRFHHVGRPRLFLGIVFSRPPWTTLAASHGQHSLDLKLGALVSA